MVSISIRRMIFVLAGLLALPVSGLCQATPPAAQTVTPATTPSTTPPAAGPGGTQSAALASSPVDAATYVIGAEDGLQVTVWKDPTLSGTFPVRPDGMISMTLLGDVQAAGLTPMQLTANLTEKLKKYIQEPVVSVVVVAVNSKRVFVVGEVGHVGPMAMTPGMTPLQAIATAGGLTPFAHGAKIYILRGEPGKQKQIPFDYKKALKGDAKQQISLQPGDTIVVP
jgi:polysaccharide export outer membrane protein